MSGMQNTNRNPSGKDEEHTLETLSRYYPLREETNTFEIALHYEQASDLFDENTDSHGMAPRISDTITDQMSVMLDDIPKGYNADFFIKVDDYEGYSPKQLMQGIKDALFFRHRRFLNESTQKGLQTGALITAGVVMILILTIGKQIGWWGGDDTVSEIVTYMLDTLGCVLIWEGLYMLFVEESEEYVFERKISRKVSSINFYQEDKENIIASESRENISALMAVNRKKMFTKRLLLVSSYSLFILTVAWVLQTLGVIITPERFGEKVTADLILSMLVALLVGSAGLLSMSAYKETLHSSPIVLVLSAVILYPIINAFSTLFKGGHSISPAEAILAIFIIIAGLTYIVGIIMYFIQHRLDRLQRFP